MICIDKGDEMIKVLDKEFADKKDLYDYVQTLKDYDLVEYCGGESWKDNRSFKDFKLTHRDLHITKKHFNDLIYTLEHQVWPFCDTIFLEDMAEDDEHILDWCFHGERMGWKEGDEMWLVYNLGRDRFEIRKADHEKWTPLDKYIINNDLELRFKFGYTLLSEDSALSPSSKTVKYVQDIGVNSFPDRIELHFNSRSRNEDLTSIYQIFDYYANAKGNKEAACFFFICLNPMQKAVQKAIKENFSQFDMWRHYGLFKKDESEDMNKIYEDVLRYSHQLKFYQELDKALTAEELDNVVDEELNDEQ